MILTRDKSFYKRLLLLAIPISFQNMITYSVSFAANLMVGQISDSAISGVYLGNQVQSVLQMFIAGIEGAIIILAAQYWGRKNSEAIRKIVSIGIKVSLAFGFLFTLTVVIFPKSVIGFMTDDPSALIDGIKYVRILGVSFLFFSFSQILIASMRSVESAKIGMYVSLFALITTVSLNYIFIFGHFGIPPLGVRGAAISTLISRILEAALITFYVFKVDKKLSLKFKDLLSTDIDLFKDFVRYGFPVIGGQAVWSANMILQAAILGRYPAQVLSATSITMTLHQLIYVWMNGLSAAIGIITGKTVGAGLYEKMKEYAKTVQVIFLFVGVISGGLVFLLRDGFISLYNIGPETQVFAKQFINVISITIIGTCYQAACLFGLVKSGGDVSFVFKNDTIFVFLVVIPSGAIAMFLGASPWVVFALLKVDQILKCFVALVKINRYNWMKNLTRSGES